MDDTAAFARVRWLRNTQKAFEKSIKGKRATKAEATNAAKATKATSSLTFAVAGGKRSTSLKIVDVPFRFQDLPAEIRNNVYRLVGYQDVPLRLRHFVPPAIARVCRQLRSEALPVFFDVNTFVAEVRSTYNIHFDFKTSITNFDWIGEFMPFSEKRASQTGTLQLRREIVSLFSVSGKQTARIRNLDVAVMSSDGKLYFDAMICLRIPSAPYEPAITYHTRPLSANRDIYNDDMAADLQHMCDAAKTFLDEHVAKAHSPGLTILDMKQLANTLRVEARV